MERKSPQGRKKRANEEMSESERKRLIKIGMKIFSLRDAYFIGEMEKKYPNGVPYTVFIEMALEQEGEKKEKTSGKKQKVDETPDDSWYCFLHMLESRYC